MQISRTRDGFTLVELLVVISIIGLLSSIVLTSVNSARARARDARRLADTRQIQNALALYYDDHGSYPPVTYGPSGSLAGWEVSYKDTSNWLNQSPICPLFRWIRSIAAMSRLICFSPRAQQTAISFICITITGPGVITGARGRARLQS